MAIFSEKSHQQGRDPSLNPLFSATRSLNAREQNHASAPPPLPSQQRIHALLFAKCSNDSLSPRAARSRPCESDLIALSGQRKLTGYLLLQYTCPQPNHWQPVLYEMKRGHRGPCKLALTVGRIIQEKSQAAVYWQPAFDTVLYPSRFTASLSSFFFFFASLVLWSYRAVAHFEAAGEPYVSLGLLCSRSHPTPIRSFVPIKEDENTIIICFEGFRLTLKSCFPSGRTSFC